MQGGQGIGGGRRKGHWGEARTPFLEFYLPPFLEFYLPVSGALLVASVIVEGSRGRYVQAALPSPLALWTPQTSLQIYR